MKPPKFKVDDQVRIINCSHLSGLRGTILGVSSRHGVVDFMIVGLESPLPSGHKAVTIISSCLELISKQLSREEYCIWIEELNERFSKALKECISRAGVADPVEACRLVIKTAEDALNYQNENK